jgi:hypothetical protein
MMASLLVTFYCGQLTINHFMENYPQKGKVHKKLVQMLYLTEL